MGGIDCDLVICGVSMRQSQIIVFTVNINIGEDQLVFYKTPNYPRHLITVHFYHRIFRLNSRLWTICRRKWKLSTVFKSNPSVILQFLIVVQFFSKFNWWTGYFFNNDIVNNFAFQQQKHFIFSMRVHSSHSYKFLTTKDQNWKLLGTFHFPMEKLLCSQSFLNLVEQLG